MENYLVITSLAGKDNNLIEQFTSAIKGCNCNIEESRMTSLGNEVCITILISGTWDSIAKIEDTLSRLENKLDVSILSLRTETREKNNNMMPYAIDVVSFDHAGIVHDIVKFMKDNKINIEEMYTNTYRSATTDTKMFSLHMSINIPVDTSIAAIRGDFMDFCDQLNLDAIMEPVK